MKARAAARARRSAILLVGPWLLGVAATAAAHSAGMATIEVREVAPGVHLLESRLPSGADSASVDVAADGDCRAAGSRRYVTGSEHLTRQWLRCVWRGPSRHVTLVLPAVGADFVIRTVDLAGAQRSRVAAAGTVDVALGEPAPGVTQRLALGFRHILGGPDHLLFIGGMLLLLRGPREVAATLTAFTLAHSVTLSLAVLGLVRMPGPPVEALIALSIVLLSVEILRRNASNAAPAGWLRPWSIAFVFGLVHGFGFAGALAAHDIRGEELLSTLLLFNLGIELGQLAFAGALGIGLWLAYTWLRTAAGRRALQGTAAYGLGTVACFWLIERIAAFWP